MVDIMEGMAEVKKFGFWKTIPFSFFSQDVYRDVATRKNSGIAYVVVMAVIVSIVLSAFLSIGAVKYMKLEKVSPIIMQLPETIETKDGKLILPENRPYPIEIDGELFAVIDTSGQYTVDSLSEDLPLVFTEEYMATYSKNKVEMHRYADKMQEDFSVSRNEIYDWTNNFIENWGGVLPIAIFFITVIFMTLFFFVYKLVQVLIFSIITVILNLALKLKLDYSDVFRMTIVSLIPMTIIDAIVVYGLQIQYSLWIFFALNTCWIVFAMTSLKNKNPKVQISE